MTTTRGRGTAKSARAIVPSYPEPVRCAKHPGWLAGTYAGCGCAACEAVRAERLPASPVEERVMGDRQLHVFTNGTDWVVAYDVEDAWTAWCEHLGEERDEHEHDGFTRCPDDKPLKINNPDDDPGLPPGGALTLTMREWADRDGRGFLCSTEY